MKGWRIYGGVKAYGRWTGLGLGNTVIEIRAANHYKELFFLLSSSKFEATRKWGKNRKKQQMLIYEAS